MNVILGLIAMLVTCEAIATAIKDRIIEATNIEDCEDEMKVLDTFLFRCWQMGWLDQYEVKTE